MEVPEAEVEMNNFELRSTCIAIAKNSESYQDYAMWLLNLDNVTLEEIEGYLDIDFYRSHASPPVPLEGLGTSWNSLEPLGRSWKESDEADN